MWKRFFLHKGFLQITFESEIILLVFQTSFWFKRFRENKASEWFVISWTNCYDMFFFKLPFCPNDWLHIKQLKGLSFSWTVLTWIFIVLFCPNDLLQIKQMVFHLHELFSHEPLNHFYVQMIGYRTNTEILWFLHALFSHAYSNYFLVQKTFCKSNISSL